MHSKKTDNIALSEERNNGFMPETTARKIFRIASTALFAMFFCASFIFAALNPFHSTYSDSQATLVMIGNGISLVCLALPALIRKIFRIHVSFNIVFLWFLFLLGHSIGETFILYYRVVGWDKTLHLLSGTLQFFTFFGIARSYFAHKEFDKEYVACLVFAIAASVAFACIWEIIEFTVDGIFGTNMQKVIPPEFFNGGNTFAEINGMTEEIASFYRSPSGYRYALIDSMLDCISCLIGTVFGVIITAIINRSNKDFLKTAFCLVSEKFYALDVVSN